MFNYVWSTTLSSQMQHIQQHRPVNVNWSRKLDDRDPVCLPFRGSPSFEWECMCSDGSTAGKPFSKENLQLYERAVND